MINLDDRILDGSITESEMWLLLHITKFIGKNMVCWPSNKTLLERTGWSIGKLQSVKKALQQKGILEISERKNESGQTSNNYKLKTKYISVFVNVGEKEFIEESYPHIKNQVGVGKKPIPLSKNEYGPITKNEYGSYQNSSNEVLNNEVLKDEVLINENNSANALLTLVKNETQKVFNFQTDEETTLRSQKNKKEIHRADALQKNAIQLKEEFIAELERKGIAHYYEPFKAAWLEWIRYKKEIKNTYKSAQSAATGFKSMLEKSKYNPETALRIVETAVANCWKGLQEERHQFKPSGKSKVQEQHEDLVSYVINKRNLLNG